MQTLSESARESSPKLNHTPGPWIASRMRLSDSETDRRSGFVVNGPDTDPLPIRICDLRAPPGADGFRELKANADLIAAAPDLLAACQALVSQNVGYQAVCELARAAIAKADHSPDAGNKVRPWGFCDVCDRPIPTIGQARSINGGTLCLRCAQRRIGGAA